MAQPVVQPLILSGTDNTQAAFRSAMDNLNNFARAATNAGSAIRLIGGGFALQVAFDKLKEFAGAMVQARIEADKLRLTFAGALGAGDAGKEFAFLRIEAQRLGLPLLAVSEQYIRLAAASKGTSLEGQALRDIFSSVAERAVTLGLNVQEVEGIFRAMQQMISKGTVQAEELRGQMGERLPGAFRLGAEAMNITEAQLAKLMETGKVATVDFLPRFAQVLRRDAAGSLREAASSMQSEVNRLSNAFGELKRNIAEGPTGDALKSATALLTKGTAAVATDTKRMNDEVRAGQKWVEEYGSTWTKVASALSLTSDAYRLLGREALAYDQELERLQKRFPVPPPIATQSQVRKSDAALDIERETEAREKFHEIMKRTRSERQKEQDDVADLKRYGLLGNIDQSLIDKAVQQARDSHKESMVAVHSARRALERDTSAIIIEQAKLTANNEIDILTRKHQFFQISDSDYLKSKLDKNIEAARVEKEELLKLAKTQRDELAKAKEEAKKEPKREKEVLEIERELGRTEEKIRQVNVGIRQSIEVFGYESAVAARDYAASVEQIQIALLEIGGKDVEAAIRRFNEANKTLIQQSARAGEPAGSGLIQELREKTTAQAQYNKLRQEQEFIEAAVSRQEERTRLDLQTGRLTELEALIQISKIRGDSVPRLQAIIDKEKELAKQIGDPKLIEQTMAWQAALDAVAKTANALRDKVGEIGERVKDGMVDDFLSGSKSAVEIVRSMVGNIGRELAKLAWAGTGRKAANWLFDAIGMFLGSGGSADSSQFNFAGGTLAGERAAGGPVSTGASYLVGEKGPEIFTPSRAGTIIPNNKIGASSGGDINVKNYFNIDARTDRAEIATMIQASERRTIATIAKARRDGVAAF